MKMSIPTSRTARRALDLANQHRSHIAAALAILSLSALACSSSVTPGTTSGAGGPDAGQPDGSIGDPNTLVGTFQVRLIAPVPATANTPGTPGNTAVLGKIFDGPTPNQIVWEEVAKEGACRLSTPRVPFCKEPCGGSAACVEDDTCQDYPLAHSAGKVTVKGLQTESGAATFTMDPIADNYQPPGSVKLLYPAFAEGDEVSVEASGDYFSAFTLTAKGVAPLMILNDTITIETDKAVTLTWTPPGQAGLSKIYVKLDISHHGGTKGMLECDTDDTGSIDLPAALLTQLVNLGVAGFPTIVVSRKAAGSTTIAPGRVDLIIASDVERGVAIPGLTSCTSDMDCPNGQTCQSNLSCK
jgi:hypothetical protein